MIRGIEVGKTQENVREVGGREQRRTTPPDSPFSNVGKGEGVFGSIEYG